MILVALYVLATTDGTLCGIRSGAGRSSLIHKRRYYVDGMLYGAFLAQIASAISGLALFATWRLTTERAALALDLVGAAQRMLWVLVPYAIVIFASFLVRWIPSTDIRSATSVMIFGPMTAIRPVIAVASVTYGIIPAHLWSVRALGVFILALMFWVQWRVDARAERLFLADHPGSPAR
ncbi:hypothetical protein Acid345_4742 [Candidatus Koribacter versatilis Ellin345]|uniref:Uncharacterized protein n=1 Tax=Koribacter versatilis (strain Ellin345) TaxID=204669 RepID=Q1IHA9_KORVE|nr:hypothetical protein [Candidatus Koribacter versatilis]ABF43741.1 hypothetical protein Acid345_4742 [Candidatus Koribacter versatilis Ellin345]